MGILTTFFNIVKAPIPRPLPVKIIEWIVLSELEKVPSKILNIGKIKSAEYGDVIGVRRQGYKHFGIYINDDSVIHYASLNGDFGNDICVHETTLENFLNGSENYFVCKFPKYYGKPSEFNVTKMSPEFFDGFPIEMVLVIFDILKRLKYRIYSPEETVKRAYERINENKYNLLTNNCEHFAIWCKTGISESHQVEELLMKIPVKIISK